MYLKNTTDYSDKYLRRVISWCCKQLDMPVRESVKIARFTRCSHAWRGRAWKYHKEILVRIGDEKHFPYTPFYYSTGCPQWIDTRLQALITVVAHEIVHIRQSESRVFNQGHGREKHAQKLAANTLIAFLPLEAALDQKWKS